MFNNTKSDKMSGLGTTVQPAGEPGSQTHAVPIQSETVADKPQQIIQSTAIQTLDQLLHTNWIFDRTFTASTTMPAGTILYVKPIHPLEWNWPNKRVASMFNVWTGSGKIRYRPLATAWYGGSIRVGFLPPNMTMAQVMNTPLEVLTSYPNRDIDPKNTDWVDFRGPDQREISYHYMAPFDDTDRQNFGGYLVFYVAGKLVTQAPDFTTIQFITELAGDFMYDQPSPRALEPVNDLIHPLGSASNVSISNQPLCDSGDNGVGSAVQINVSTLLSLPAGGFTMSAVGLPNALGKIPSLVNHWGPTFGDYSCYETWEQEAATNHVKMNNTSLAPRINREFGTNLYCANGLLSQTTTYHRGSLDIPHFNGTRPDDLRCTIVQGAEQTAPSNDDFTNRAYVFTTAGGNANPVNPALTATTIMTLSPLTSGESIVTFVNTETRFFAPQTTIISNAVKKWPRDETSGDVSWIYNIVNSNGVPLNIVRLNPNGIFTANAVSANVIYPGEIYLKFVQTLPLSSPLPPMTASMRTLKNNLTKLVKRPYSSELKAMIDDEINYA